MRVLLLLVFSSAAALAQSTGSLTGRVVDDLGDPLPGANIAIEGTPLGATTDADGRYLLLGIPVGIYTVTASLARYPSVTYQEVWVRTGAALQADFELGGWGAWLALYIRREPPLVSRDPFASRVLSGEEIARLPTGR